MKSRIPRRQAAAVAALVVCTSHLARATTPEVARVAIADSTLRRSPANTNEGASGILVVGQAGRNRVVVDFDLAGIEATHVTSARLVLNIKKNVGSWGRSGRTVDVSPLLVPFDEGSGRTFGVPAGERTRGGGPGVTWECSSDAEIADVSTDCAATWGGGTTGPPADSLVLLNSSLGEAGFDVTADAQAGRSSWLIKRTDPRGSGGVYFHSREGAAVAGDMDLAPRLLLVVDPNDAPVVAVSGGHTSYEFGAPPVIIDPALSVTDADPLDRMIGATVVGSAAGFGPGDVLSFDPALAAASGISGAYDGAGTGTLTFTGSATAAQYQALLRTVSFATDVDTDVTLGFVFTVDDGLATNSGTRSVVVHGSREPADDDRPNILFILSDDQRPDALGASGNTSIRTPNLDRLAREGVRMESFYVASPICAASRASLLTARYGHQTDVLGNIATGPYRAPPDLNTFGFPTADLAPGTTTIAHALGAAGYVTGFVGKAHLGGDPRVWGFEETPVWLRGASTPHLNPDLQYSGSPTPGGHVTEIFANAAIDFVERHRDDRWFLWLAPTAPHVPFYVAPEHTYRLQDIAPPPLWPPGQPLSLTDWVGYYATTSLLDEQVGRLLDRLRNLGLLDRTLVVFISDNGYMQSRFGDDNRLATKGVWYEESARVPALVRLPRRVPAGGVVRAPLDGVDVPATFLDVAGAPPLPGASEARSMLPALTGGPPARDAAFSEIQAPSERLWRWQMVRTERYKYVHFDDGAELLYDLVADPHETTSVAGDPDSAGILADHRARRLEWLAATPR